MSLFSRHPATRWLVPAVAVAVLLGGTALVRGAVTASSATSPASLPTVTTTQLVSDVATTQTRSVSGTIVQTSNLGIPDLPGLSTSGGSSLTTLLSGTHTLRVWADGGDRQRLALLSQLGETDVIHNGKDLWIWSSQSNSASHRTLTAPTSTSRRYQDYLPTETETPQAAANLALTMISPSTTVSLGANDVVAGRAAYELVLQPKDANSLISSVRIAIDGVEHIPLRVQILARNSSTPAVDIGFTAVDFGTPDAAEFSFNPPPGSTDTDQPAGPAPKACGTPSTTAPQAAADAPKLVGSGWTTVVVASLSSMTGADGCGRTGVAQDLGIGSLAGISRSLPSVSGAWGSGHLLTGTIASVLFTADGRIVAGAVPPAQLYAALAAS